MEKLLFTSESVTEGHPDKMCDAISDAILDACMEQDPMSRVACETASCTGFVLVTGEITTKAQLDIPSIVRKTVNEIGYNDAKTGFDGHTCAVMVALDQQSPDMALTPVSHLLHNQTSYPDHRHQLPLTARQTFCFLLLPMLCQHP